ncbi:hypothetical protein E2C01_046725 [Portunus trituberculatus]|uniref:Uncharacterized protein n=1 Tax=Portunus trituberculatus TaxID=210409 RepID=A0A5B7G5X0_PORTR|nr:hypothetical protein [Portunus trituberculatus]
MVRQDNLCSRDDSLVQDLPGSQATHGRVSQAKVKVVVVMALLCGGGKRGGLGFHVRHTAQNTYSLFHHHVSLRDSALQLEALGAIRTLRLAEYCHPWLAGVTIEVLQSADETIFLNFLWNLLNVPMFILK